MAKNIAEAIMPNIITKESPPDSFYFYFGIVGSVT